jgi:hypothetical protein
MNYYNQYHVKKTNDIQRIKEEFILEYDRAREKNLVVKNWIDKLKDEFNQLNKQSLETGIQDFKKEWENQFHLNSSIDLEQAFEIARIAKYASIDIQQFELLASLEAIPEIMQFVESNRLRLNEIDLELSARSRPIWIGENETEFLQLIEGLIDIKRLDPNVVGGKWKLMEVFANFVGIKLSKNAKSNLSKSKRERNNDYIPSIFTEILKNWDTTTNEEK